MTTMNLLRQLRTSSESVAVSQLKPGLFVKDMELHFMEKACNIIWPLIWLSSALVLGVRYGYIKTWGGVASSQGSVWPERPVPALPGMKTHPAIYSYQHITCTDFLHLSSTPIKCEKDMVLLLRRLVKSMALNPVFSLILFRRAMLVTKMDLRLLPGGSGEESTAFPSVLMH